VTSFDRRKCKVTNGPTATGNHCPEGWTVYRKRDQKADESDHYYLTYMDREDVFGIGTKNVPYFGGANSDSLVGLNPETGKFDKRAWQREYMRKYRKSANPFG